MSEWISVEDRLPENTDRGIHDCIRLLVLTNEPYGKVGAGNIKVNTWMNNRWVGFPAGATVITHWMPLPELPEGA